MEMHTKSINIHHKLLGQKGNLVPTKSSIKIIEGGIL